MAYQHNTYILGPKKNAPHFRGEKVTFKNVADLVNPKDSKGRTYREINNTIKHKLSVGDRVETYDNMVLFITKHTRDCDGTPLYSLGDAKGRHLTNGYSEDSVKLYVQEGE